MRARALSFSASNLCWAEVFGGSRGVSSAVGAVVVRVLAAASAFRKSALALFLAMVAICAGLSTGVLGPVGSGGVAAAGKVVACSELPLAT